MALYEYRVDSASRVPLKSSLKKGWNAKESSSPIFWRIGISPIYWRWSVIGKSQVVYLGSFLRVGWFGEVSGGRPMGGKGGGIPRLLDMMITSAMAMFETAWITVCGGLFFLCSSVIWATSDRSPVT